VTFPGILYEPRAFWSIARIDTAVGSGERALGVPANVLRFPERDFFNGEKYPITLRKVLMSPVGYWLDRLDLTLNPATAALRQNNAAQQEHCRLQIAAPQRQYYSRFPISAANYAPVPSWHPAAAGQNGMPAHSSGYINTSRWDFDHDMIIPQKGYLEMGFGSINLPGWDGAGNAPRPDVRIGVYEKGGLLNGNARVSPQIAPGGVTNEDPITVDYLGGFPGPPANAPWGPNNFGFAATIIGNFGRWPPRTAGGRLTTFRTRDYDAQNVSSAGSTPVSGFGVAIDQQGWDDAQIVQAAGLPGFNSAVMAPFAVNLPVRARMRNGGTGQWWWRPGAPLALVCPSMTPAYVYELPEPITLAPGDQLNVELEIPNRFVDSQGNPIDTVYQLGVSLCGEAAIEA
jgi:hypothetical protein